MSHYDNISRWELKHILSTNIFLNEKKTRPKNERHHSVVRNKTGNKTGYIRIIFNDE